MTILEFRVAKSFVDDIQKAVVELVEWDPPSAVLESALEELAVANAILSELIAAASIRERAAASIVSPKQLARIAESN